MARHRRVWPIRWMSQALGVSTSGFYEWFTRPESNRSMTNRTILVRIRESFEASHQTYGSPRVWRDLRDWNVPCSENRTARLMRQAGLVARVRLKIPRYVAGRRSMTAPNVLDRQFQADAPNQKWVADFTYIPTREGWLYPLCRSARSLFAVWRVSPLDLRGTRLRAFWRPLSPRNCSHGSRRFRPSECHARPCVVLRARGWQAAVLCRTACGKHHRAE
jgi:hypothetical protein